MMSGTQPTIPFAVRKKCNFYNRKEEVKEDFTNATARCMPSRYVPVVKKIVTLTSSESESDSDIENTTESKIINERRANENAGSTPRRRKCDVSDGGHTPSPPKQRRDKLQSSLTPSTLLNKLDLSSEKEGKFTPKQLFDSYISEDEDELAFKPISGSNKYQNARKALHGSVTENLPGREEELARLQRYLLEHLDQKTSGSLYISGPPGTGKTASLFKIMQQPDVKTKFKVVSMKSGKNSKAIIEKYLMSKHKTLLLVLDEIDQLESRKQSVLYSIFEWPSIPNSKLILIGIANALDLFNSLHILHCLHSLHIVYMLYVFFTPYVKNQFFTRKRTSLSTPFDSL